LVDWYFGTKYEVGRANSNDEFKMIYHPEPVEGFRQIISSTNR